MQGRHHFVHTPVQIMSVIYTWIQYNMWWLIQNIIFSACLIVLIHYLYVYFETTLTTPKVKDLIRGQKHEYKSLLESINKKIDQPMTTTTSSPFPPAPSSSSQISTEPLGITLQSSDDMKSDLKQYVREIGQQQYQPS